MQISLIVRQEGSGDGECEISTPEELDRLSEALGLSEDLVGILRKLLGVRCSALRAVASWPKAGGAGGGVTVYWVSPDPSPWAKKLEVGSFFDPGISIAGALAELIREMEDRLVLLRRAEESVRRQAEPIG